MKFEEHDIDKVIIIYAAFGRYILRNKKIKPIVSIVIIYWSAYHMHSHNFSIPYKKLFFFFARASKRGNAVRWESQCGARWAGAVREGGLR